MSDDDNAVCAVCGCDTPADDTEWLGMVEGEVCRGCYDENTFECVLSGESFEETEKSRFILVKWEFAPSGWPAGIYRLRGEGCFMSLSMLGGGFLWKERIEFVAELPRPDAEFELSGWLSREAARPYERRWKRAYRHAPASGARRYQIEERHARRRLLLHREKVAEIEEDADWPKWRDLRRNLKLPELKTFTDWLFVEHKGVRVYEDWRGTDSWLLLRPEPEHRRGGRSPWSFSPGNLVWKGLLPKFAEPKPEGGCWRDGNVGVRRWMLLVCRAAIDAGILTQDGVVVPVSGSSLITHPSSLVSEGSS